MPKEVEHRMLRSFTSFSRRQSTSEDLPISVRDAVPDGCEAIAEAIVAGQDAAPASSERGRKAAQDGVSLAEALSGLRETYRLLSHEEPDFSAAEALAVAWSEGTLEYLHQLSCEDPTTGLATHPHLRTRLTDTYRGAARRGEDVSAAWALVLVELPEAPTTRGEHFERLLCLARVGEAMRTVFSGDESIGKVGADRAAALVHRHAALGASVSLLRGLLADLRLPCGDPRVWIEGLPAKADSGVSLLDELAR